jgi:cytochrome c oxidase subunit I
MYFAIAYEVWPRLTGRPLDSEKLARWQRWLLWLWFLGMLIVTIEWHVTGLMGQPRRVAVFDHNDPFVARMGPLVVVSFIGGLVLLLSAALFIFILIRSHFGERAVSAPLRYALAANPPAHVPSSLNGFAFGTPFCWF